MNKFNQYILSPIINLCAKNNSMRNFVTKIVADPKKAAMALVLSQVAKDAFGCFFYVNQSLNNKEIPKEKRKFVAALDLSNGILMMVSQFTLGKLFVSDKVKKLVDTKIIDKIVKTPALRVQAKKVSGIILPMIGSAIIAKRVIVPLIATPVASVFKNKLFDKKEEKPKLQIPEQTSIIKQRLKAIEKNNVIAKPNNPKMHDTTFSSGNMSV